MEILVRLENKVDKIDEKVEKKLTDFIREQRIINEKTITHDTNISELSKDNDCFKEELYEKIPKKFHNLWVALFGSGGLFVIFMGIFIGALKIFRIIP